MARLACVELPSLSLQLLLLREPAWRARPAAVIERDAAEAAVLALDERARRAGVRIGQRYASALALCRELAAGVVEPAELARCRDAVLDVLRRHSPRITVSVEASGAANVASGGAAWWLDLAGFERLQPSLACWTAALQRDLSTELGLCAAVVVGFRRFATLTIARELSGARALITSSPADEQRALGAARLEHAGLELAVLAELERLGVRTFGALLALPEEGLARRYGAAVARLARCAAGREEPSFAAVPGEPPAVRRIEIEELAQDVAHVLALCEEPLAALLAELHERGLALAELSLRLELEHASPLVETLRPAEPTLERAQLLPLLALRLDGRALAAPVAALELGCRAVAASAAQLELYGVATTRRDLSAASRAFAALRALYGDACVVRARLVAAHLPESCYAWEPLERLEAPRACRSLAAPLVRRLLEAPEGVLAPGSREPDGWLARGLRHGPVVRVVGPYLLAGGWWGAEVLRDYYYAELRSGEILWLFHDRRRSRWRLHGGVG